MPNQQRAMASTESSTATAQAAMGILDTYVNIFTIISASSPAVCSSSWSDTSSVANSHAHREDTPLGKAGGRHETCRESSRVVHDVIPDVPMHD
jgi:hypothetical protein